MHFFENSRDISVYLMVKFYQMSNLEISSGHIHSYNVSLKIAIATMDVRVSARWTTSITDTLRTITVQYGPMFIIVKLIPESVNKYIAATCGSYSAINWVWTAYDRHPHILILYVEVLRCAKTLQTGIKKWFYPTYCNIEMCSQRQRSQ